MIYPYVKFSPNFTLGWRRIGRGLYFATGCGQINWMSRDQWRSWIVTGWRYYRHKLWQRLS